MIRYGIFLLATSLFAQTGSRLVLAPSEPLTEPHFPKATSGAEQAPAVRPSILRLKPAADPITVHEESEPAAGGEWRTYRRPKVAAFSRDADGVAIQGYDAVSYLGERAEKGRPEFAAEHGGVEWWFSSSEHRELFRNDPERYLPAYGGFCAYSVGKGYPATADPKSFSVSGGKLYLFFDRAVKAVWEQDQAKLIAAADRNWPRIHR